MIFRTLFKRYRCHLKCFYDDFDSIKEISIDNEHHKNVILRKQISNKLQSKMHYVIGMLTILYVAIDSVLIIKQENIFQSRNWTAISSIKMLFPHRIFPQTFWYQADITAFICLTMAMILFLFSCTLPPMPEGACLFALTDKQTGKIIKLVDVSGEGIFIPKFCFLI